MQEQTIFIEALEKEDSAERAAYLDQVCGGDAALRERIERLLRRHEQPDSFLETPAPGAFVANVESVREAPGTVIGPYKLLEQIGEGGFGVVFMAEQHEPIRRKVALKVLKPGMDTRQVIARFEAERQALALMDHPNIAGIHDTGTTATGRPYFVMELVKGIPLTDYCDQNQLTPRERLELFVPVCQAIQHAHQKGIIHRDVKPSNVLVTLLDGTPVVKVIDFGVAKVIGQQLMDKTLVTGFAQMIGTPLYMSPEQAAISAVDVDTRSDIYSLGVLLYELLTGTTPFDRERLRDVGFDELRRIIREEEPPKPSTRISTLGQAATTVSAHRKSDPKRLSQLFRGELDWIVMKALEKDRNRRYETASAFAADVQRYLKDEPVEACPPSAWYRCRKFVRRHKPVVVTSAALLTVLVLAGGGGLWLLGQRVARDRDVVGHLEEAERWERQGNWPQALQAVERAKGRLAGGGPATLRRRAEQVRERERFVADLEDSRLTYSAIREGTFDLAGADGAYAEAFKKHGWDVQTLAAEEIAEQIAASPIRAQLVAALDFWAYIKPQEDIAGREKLWTIARLADDDDWRRQVRDPEVRKNRAALERLARQEGVLDQPPGSLQLLAGALVEREARSAAVDLLRRAQQRHPDDFWLNFHLGVKLYEAKKWDDAVGYFQAALAVRPKTVIVYNNLGIALAAEGRLDEAIQEFRIAIDLDPKAGLPHSNLGDALRAKRQLDEAIREFRTAIDLDPNAALPHNGLGNALRDKGQLDEAIREFRTAIDLDPKFAVPHDNLGGALREKGQLDEAIQEFRTAIDLDPKFAQPHNNLGSALADKGQLDEAIREFRTAIDLDPKLAGPHDNLGLALREKGQLDEAIREFRTAVDLDPKDAWPHYNLGNALYAKGQPDEAIREYRKAIELDPKVARLHNGLGNALRDKGQLDEAIREFRTAVDLDLKFAQPHDNLGSALATKGQLDEAIREFRTAVDLDPKFARPHYNLGVALRDKGKLDEAIREFRTAIDLDPKDARAHCNLGAILCDVKHDYDGAITCFRRAIELDPQLALAHFNLGNALRAKGDLDGAIAAYRRAIELDPKDARAHCNLGQALWRRGEFAESLAAYKRGHELGSQQKDWRYPSGEWVRQAERLVELDGRLPDILRGQAQPKDAGEQLEIAKLCSYKKLYAHSARFAAEAFAAEPKRADDLKALHRYGAACAAALAAAGQGKDDPAPDAKERARLRQQALDWLRADQALRTKQLESERPADRTEAQQALRHWQRDPELAGLREPDAVTQLPSEQQQACRKLWADVEDLLTKARDSK